MAASAALAAALLLAGCKTIGSGDKAEVIEWSPPSSGPVADLTVKTERMWLANRVTAVLLGTGKRPDGPRQVHRLGQLQSGEYVRREILAFDARLPAGVPLWMHFEYRYDTGSPIETGCDFPLSVTLKTGARYVLDFIKTPTSCRPKLYVRDEAGALAEVPIEPN